MIDYFKETSKFFILINNAREENFVRDEIKKLGYCSEEDSLLYDRLCDARNVEFEDGQPIIISFELYNGIVVTGWMPGKKFYVKHSIEYYKGKGYKQIKYENIFLQNIQLELEL